MRLSQQEARRRFAAARVARLATVSGDGVPHLVPFTFAVLGDQVVFVVDDKPKTTTRLRRLDNIAANPAVSLLVDVYDDDWSRLWWVRADGTAGIADSADVADHAIDALAARYPAYVERRPAGPVVVIAVSQWTGWAATAEPPEPPEPLRPR